MPGEIPVPIPNVDLAPVASTLPVEGMSLQTEVPVSAAPAIGEMATAAPDLETAAEIDTSLATVESSADPNAAEPAIEHVAGQDSEPTATMQATINGVETPVHDATDIAGKPVAADAEKQTGEAQTDEATAVQGALKKEPEVQAEAGAVEVPEPEMVEMEAREAERVLAEQEQRIEGETTQRMQEWESRHPQPTEETHPVQHQREDAVNQWHRDSVAARQQAYADSAVNEGLRQWETRDKPPTEGEKAANTKAFADWQERRVAMESTLRDGTKDILGSGQEPQTAKPAEQKTEETGAQQSNTLKEDGKNEEEGKMKAKDEKKEGDKKQKKKEEEDDDPETAAKRAKLARLQQTSANLAGAIGRMTGQEGGANMQLSLKDLQISKEAVDKQIAELQQEIAAGKRGGKLQKFLKWLGILMMGVSAVENVAKTPEDTPSPKGAR